ncbi:endonuclease/exonuclease/phosphatase family protein [Pontibacter populi]|uniref:Endonuclease/exonuclease/phosphatase family protein n=1 Tax=Pontibacter populi TaxID=890055 RepID=A0ABV1RYX0_9BACT
MKTAKNITFYLTLSLGTLLIVVTLLSLIYNVRFWYLKVLDFPRVQVLISLIVLLIIFAVLNNRWKSLSYLFLAGMISSIALQAHFIFPYTTLAGKTVESLTPAEAENSQTFSLLVANVWMKNEQVADFLEMVHNADPDIVLAMEINQWWSQQLTALQEMYPHRVVYPMDNTYGIALYSKLPLRDTEVKFLNHKEVPSIHTQVKVSGNVSFVLHAMHPVPPKPSKYPDNIGEKAVSLLKVGKMVQQRQLPTVVAGDFNDVAWSKTSRLFGTESKLGDIRIGRGLYNSFDATSLIMRWPLDHIYVSNEFKVVIIQRLPKFGSDHFPIYVKLALTE